MTRVRVGDVEVRVEYDLTRKELRALLKLCASIQVALAPVEEERPPIGFTAHMERLPDDMADVFYEDEE